MRVLIAAILGLFFLSNATTENKTAALFVPPVGMSAQMITAAENTGYGPNLHGDVNIPFLLFTPPDAAATMAGQLMRNGQYVYGKKYPIIIHHHGIGERTDNFTSPGAVNTSELNDLYTTGPPNLMRTSTGALYDKRFAAPGTTDSTEFFWLFPQVYGGYNYTFLVYNSEPIKWIKKNLAWIVDTTRIYIAGLSFGGGACWVAGQDSLLNMQIAAMAPIAPGYLTYTGLHLTGTPGNNDQYNFSGMARSRIPVYGIHAINDPETPKPSGTTDGAYISNRCFDSLNKYKIAAPWVYRKRNDGGHNVWTAAWDPQYANTSFMMVNGQTYKQTPSIQSWLLQFSTKGRRHLFIYLIAFTPVIKRRKVITLTREERIAA